ncbi:uncharacterized protein V1518DRAFT_422849 [Limtongia smithiae]|uniref:uncharacterized protein n=1 Tax=Limtongia smithiae TaxID=1125753 RepID=UPI0034CFDC67
MATRTGRLLIAHLIARATPSPGILFTILLTLFAEVYIALNEVTIACSRTRARSRVCGRAKPRPPETHLHQAHDIATRQPALSIPPCGGPPSMRLSD